MKISYENAPKNLQKISYYLVALANFVMFVGRRVSEKSYHFHLSIHQMLNVKM